MIIASVGVREEAWRGRELLEVMRETASAAITEGYYGLAHAHISQAENYMNMM